MAGIGPPVRAAQPLAVEEVGATALGTKRRTGEAVDRLTMPAVGAVIGVDEGSPARRHARGPVGAGHRQRHELIQRTPRGRKVSGLGGGFDQLGKREGREERELIRYSPRRGEGIGVPAEPVVADRARETGDLQGVSIPVLDELLVGCGGWSRSALVRGEQLSAVRRHAYAGGFLDGIVFRYRRGRRFEVTAARCHEAVVVEREDQRGERAPLTGPCDLPGTQLGPAGDIP